MFTPVEMHLHNIAKNIDYALRINQAKYVLVASDCNSEGKSTFLAECVPVLTQIYKKKILIYDCQPERGDTLEKRMSPTPSSHQFIHQTDTRGLDYLHNEDLFFIKDLPDTEKNIALMSHFNEITKDYDLVFINMKTLKRAEKTSLPVLPIDGAILVRSTKGIKLDEKVITNELVDREIPIVGLIKNEGL
jgi:hypothetical protein